MIGKSVLASQVIKRLQTNSACTTVYHAYTYHEDGNDGAGVVLRSIVRQIVRQQRHLATFIYSNYLLKGREPSLQSLRELLKTLSSGIADLCIVIDGLNECENADMKEILLALSDVSSKQTAKSDHCKVMVFSTNIGTIGKVFKRADIVSLNEEKAAINSAIHRFVHDKLEEVQLDRDDLSACETLFADLEQDILAKAGGKLFDGFICYRIDAHSCRDVLVGAPHAVNDRRSPYHC